MESILKTLKNITLTSQDYSKILFLLSSKLSNITDQTNKANKANKEQKIKKNKGKGAGGVNTNKNGLKFEKDNKLDKYFEIIKEYKYYTKIKFKINLDKEFIKTIKSNFFKYMNYKKDKTIENAHGCKCPDLCFIDEIKKIIYIIEMKFQQVNGSVCEKIQTAPFKKWQYSRLFPNYKINYIYCLSPWFEINCKAEIQYLNENKIPLFFSSNSNCKKKIIDFLITD